VTIDYLDNATEGKARRNVLIASFATFLIANLKLETNTLEVLSLRFIVEPQRLVAMGQLICFLLLCIFLLRIAPRAVEEFKAFWKVRFLKFENESLADLRFDLFGYEGEVPGNSSPQKDFDDAQQRLMKMRERREGIFNSTQKFLVALSAVTIDFLVPFALSLTAILNPYLVSTNLIPFVQKFQ
jgi:hypothetical protein